MRSEVADRESGDLTVRSVRDVAELRLIEEGSHVERRPVDRQSFTQLGHPVVIEVEVHATRQRVPRFEPLDVDRERRVAAAAGLRARPFG